ncbi:MAG: hypothetical protein ACYC9M_05185 [Desulfobulbaceae bacterium]
MLESLPEFLRSYWMYLVGAAVVFATMSYYSEKFFDYLKKGLILLAVLFALLAGYELISGKSIFTLPGRIDEKLSEDPSQTETGRRYYRSYEERFGEKAPQ